MDDLIYDKGDYISKFNDLSSEKPAPIDNHQLMTYMLSRLIHKDMNQRCFLQVWKKVSKKTRSNLSYLSSGLMGLHYLIITQTNNVNLLLKY